MRPESIGYAIVASTLGRLLVAATARGVCLVRFVDGMAGEADEALGKTVQREFPFAVVASDGTVVRYTPPGVSEFLECENELLPAASNTMS